MSLVENIDYVINHSKNNHHCPNCNIPLTIISNDVVYGKEHYYRFSSFKCDKCDYIVSVNLIEEGLNSSEVYKAPRRSLSFLKFHIDKIYKMLDCRVRRDEKLYK